MLNKPTRKLPFTGCSSRPLHCCTLGIAQAVIACIQPTFWLFLLGCLFINFFHWSSSSQFLAVYCPAW